MPCVADEQAGSHAGAMVRFDPLTLWRSAVPVLEWANAPGGSFNE